MTATVLLEAAMAGLLVGLLGQVHCFAMCGGITGALALRARRAPQPLRWLLLANTGRLLAYTSLGAAAGAAGAGLLAVAPAFGPLLRGLAAVMLVLVALQLFGVPGLAHWLERPFRGLGPMLGRLAGRQWPPLLEPLALGAAWGLLPCGLVYGAVALALAQQHPLAGATTLLAFGLGTLPGVLALGSLGRLLQRRPLARRSAAVATLAFAAWTLLPVLGLPGGHSGHAPQRTPSGGAADTVDPSQHHHPGNTHTDHVLPASLES